MASDGTSYTGLINEKLEFIFNKDQIQKFIELKMLNEFYIELITTFKKQQWNSIVLGGKMCLEGLRKFQAKAININQLVEIKNFATKARRDALEMISLSGSGHPGGALSSIDIYTMLWLCSNVEANMVTSPERDRIVVSHGHTSAGVYAVLGNSGYFDINAVKCTFRKNGSIFEGHPSLKVPGVEWCNGSLGQGLSIGSGFALAAKMKKLDYHTFVVMGDGEQGKGQIQEAREFAVKYGLGNLTAIIDLNGLQASGKVENIMPQNIAAKYQAAGLKVQEVDGHDFDAIYQALKCSYENREKPTVILAKTVMGKGVSAIENNFEYHGRVLTEQQLNAALNELKCESNVAEAVGKVEKCNNIIAEKAVQVEHSVKYGNPIMYLKDQKVDLRTAFGEALCDIAVVNNVLGDVKIAALDCDLLESVKLQKFKNKFPDNLIECGIQEHNAVSVSGALSKSGILTFFADFGVFGIDETYGQHRMNDINNTSVKLICTHIGLDVGEDGKTHQCIDYISTMSNLFGFKIIIPADANQTDRVVRYAATNQGNILIAMGRSKLPVLLTEDENEFFDINYKFVYGRADWIRKGSDGTIITYGTMVNKAINVQKVLKEKDIHIGVLNVSCPLEIDEQAIKLATNTGLIVTYEDHNVKTGLGSIIGTYLIENGLNCNFKRVGIKQYGVSASPENQYIDQNMDESSLIKLIEIGRKK